MRRFLLVISVAAALLHFTHAAWSQETLQARHAELWQAFETELLNSEPSAKAKSQIVEHAASSLTTLAMPGVHLDTAGNPASAKLAKRYAFEISRLAKAAVDANQPTLAYQYLHQAAFLDSKSHASRIVGNAVNTASRKPTVKRASINHPALPWKRKQYLRISSDHFLIVTNASEQQGIEVADRLESLYAAWSQLFFDCWSRSDDLKKAMKTKRRLQPKVRAHHTVVLFADRDEYISYLQPKQPRIAITLGFYDVDSRTSFFFAGPDASDSTQLHEVTHQLFQEVQPNTSSRLPLSKNFWVIEAMSLYMESLRIRESTATVGGLGADRLQFARYRRLQEDFYVPLNELVRMGRDELQNDERIRRIYSQSAGLAHFMMDGRSARYRASLIRYLRLIYVGRDRLDTLSRLTGTELETLDQQYRDFLDINDERLGAAFIAANTLESLCLGRTTVSDAGLKHIPEQTNLRWLDLAFTRATDDGLSVFAGSRQLEQVNLEGTQITDQTLEWLAENESIDELDLSGTRLTDQGLRKIATLPGLRVLWLTGTSVTDDSIDLLLRIKSLEQLGIGGTKISTTGRQRFVDSRPNVAVE